MFVLSIIVCTVGYVCIFCGDQVFVYCVSFLFMIIIYEALYTWCLRHSICSAWFLYIRISTCYVYICNFFIMKPPPSSQCMEELQILLQCFDRLVVPVAEQMLEGPVACLTFLGIKLDIIQMVWCLLPHKLKKLKELVVEWLPKRACWVRDLQLLIGKLQHACKVVHPGKTFP